MAWADLLDDHTRAHVAELDRFFLERPETARDKASLVAAVNEKFRERGVVQYTEKGQTFFGFRHPQTRPGEWHGAFIALWTGPETAYVTIFDKGHDYVSLDPLPVDQAKLKALPYSAWPLMSRDELMRNFGCGRANL